MNQLVLTGAWVLLVIGAAGFSYWCACRIADAVEALREAVDLLNEARDNNVAAADDAHRAVTILREWWSEAVIVDLADTDVTPAVRTDTAEAPAVNDFAPRPRPKLRDPREIGYEHDPQVAEVLAHAENDLTDMRVRWAAMDDTSTRRTA